MAHGTFQVQFCSQYASLMPDCASRGLMIEPYGRQDTIRVSLGSEERGAFWFCRSGCTVPPFPLLINFDVNDGSGWISGLARMFCWIPVVRR